MAGGLLTSGDIIESRFICKVNGAHAMVTFHHIVTDAGIGNDLETIAPAIVEKYDGLLAAVQSEEVTDRKIAVQLIFPLRYLALVYTSPNTIGEVAAPAQPSGVAVVCQRKGAFATRHAQGRIYVPGTPISYAQGNFINPANMDGFDNLADTFPDSISNVPETVTVTPVIYNKSNPAASLIVVAGIATSELRYQRRREPSVGL